MWKPDLNSHVSEFAAGDWISPPTYKNPYYSEQLFSGEEAKTIFYGLLQGYASRGFHHVYEQSGRGGVLNRSVRDTHDLSSHAQILRQHRVEERMRECAERGVEYLTGKSLRLRPTVDIQILGYERKGKFTQHADSHIWAERNGQMVWDNNSPERKISTICWLSSYRRTPMAPNEFNGGQLKMPYILQDEKSVVVEPTAGQQVVFPSHPLYSHEVVPVLKGYRMALVVFWNIL